MTMAGEGVLAFWHDVAPGGDGEFDQWHLREHIPERLAVPGFLRARRYATLGAPPRYFYFYETESLDTLQSPAYLARLADPTPWTRRTMPLVRNNIRTACRVAATWGAAVGGVIATLQLGPRAGHEDELRSWLSTTALPGAAEHPGIVASHLLEGDAGVSTAARSDEKKLLATPDALVRWVVLVEGIDAAAAEATCRDLLSPETLARHGGADGATLGLYRLQLVLGER
ncbi:MAG TPA: hypothetical protein VNU02_11260 [Candidatus Dormibacteraeota bacterium]|nr:hypothetical protein [Candidatus Dormibacteraeota bacterium]